MARPASRGLDTGPSAGPLTVLDALEAETALDAEVAAGDVMILGRCDLDDRIILDVKGEVAAHPAVRAYGVDLRLLLRLPLARLSQPVLVHGHQGAGRTDRDAVPAVHARRLRQRNIELGRDVRVETSARDGDREGV